jgi:hypothetical protein
MNTPSSVLLGAGSEDRSWTPELCDLPDDILVQILGAATDISGFRRASKGMLALSDRSVRNLVVHGMHGKPSNRVPTRVPAFVGRLENLEHLDMSGCKVSDLGPLSSLTTLKHLSLSASLRRPRRCKPVDLRPLATLAALENLDLSLCTGVLDFRPLATLTTLRRLNLAACLIADLTPLAALAALEDLDLWRCEKVHDLGPLASCKALRRMDLAFCINLVSIAPLASCKAMQNLDIRNMYKLQRTDAIDHIPVVIRKDSDRHLWTTWRYSLPL